MNCLLMAVDRCHTECVWGRVGRGGEGRPNGAPAMADYDWLGLATSIYGAARPDSPVDLASPQIKACSLPTSAAATRREHPLGARARGGRGAASGGRL